MNIEGKRLLLRVDLNVPLDGGQVADDSRIRAVLPTIHYALDNGSKLIIVSHLNRPGGKVDPRYSLAPVCERLSSLLGAPVRFIPQVRGEEVRAAVDKMAPGTAVMLENVRFDPGEESNEEGFAKDLASLADVYIDDAFADAHRSHASNVGVTALVPDSGGGFLMRREMTTLGKALESPQRPLVVVVGGAKVKSKMGVIEHLSRKADRILLGGVMALPFLMAQGRFAGRHGTITTASSTYRRPSSRPRPSTRASRAVSTRDGTTCGWARSGRWPSGASRPRPYATIGSTSA